MIEIIGAFLMSAGFAFAAFKDLKQRRLSEDTPHLKSELLLLGL